MKMNIKFANEAILNRQGLNHLEVELIPPKLENNQRKKLFL